MGNLFDQPVTIADAALEIQRSGYCYIRGLGRLRVGGLSRAEAWIGAGLMTLVFVILLSAANLRSAGFQAQAIRAQLADSQAQGELITAQIETVHARGQLIECSQTVARYQNALEQASTSAQQAAASDPNAAQMVRLIALLKRIL
jgi:hypothetical protein